MLGLIRKDGNVKANIKFKITDDLTIDERLIEKDTARFAGVPVFTLETYSEVGGAIAVSGDALKRAHIYQGR